MNMFDWLSDFIVFKYKLHPSGGILGCLPSHSLLSWELHYGCPPTVSAHSSSLWQQQTGLGVNLNWARSVESFFENLKPGCRNTVNFFSCLAWGDTYFWTEAATVGWPFWIIPIFKEREKLSQQAERWRAETTRVDRESEHEARTALFLVSDGSSSWSQSSWCQQQNFHSWHTLRAS